MAQIEPKKMAQFDRNAWHHYSEISGTNRTVLSTESTNQFNAAFDYYNFLVEKEENRKERKEVLELIVFSVPSDNNLVLLKNYVENDDGEINFENYWF